ncbi:MAG: TldD/PmbA family protein [Dehalococcoidia bacterium]|nr:TldD/PmbA family protein [Dehalococcoidia bacterium]
METGKLRDRLADALKGHDADYVEIRFEETQASRIVYRGDRLEEISRTSSLGGNVRALIKAGWGFTSFNHVDKLRDNADLAVKQARLVGKEDTKFSQTEPVTDIVTAETKKDPTTVPLASKKQLLDEYNAIILSTPKIQTSNVSYHDSRKKVVLATSEGTYIEQSRVDLNLRLSAIASADGQVQQVGLSMGSRGDFATIESLHDQVKEMAQRAVRLLSAPQAKGGEYTVILDPVLAGVFVHEAFGHLSEADHVHENKRLQDLMRLGRRFGGKHLNIVDGAAVPGLRGSYQYDDEGVPATKTHLIREGILESRLHSRETAATMGEKPTGNARALNYRFAPIVRMTNTFIEPGSTSFEEMLSDIKEGIYAKDWYGGTTSLEMFTFSAGEAYMIRNGKVAELLRPVVLTGNVFTTLVNIDAVGNDLKMNQGGGCGKAGQAPLPVSNGSPHIRISRCLVGGN